jgi:CheY-like chemotaxis protein
MNKILIIEDDDRKRAHVNSVIRRATPNAVLTEARSYQSGLKTLLSTDFDLVVLDMTMPTFDLSSSETGGRVRPFAGRDLLEQLTRRGIPCRAVVVTGFEILGEGENQKTLSALDQELQALFPATYLGSIHYNPAATDWENRLASIVSAVGGEAQ